MNGLRPILGELGSRGYELTKIEYNLAREDGSQADLVWGHDVVGTFLREQEQGIQAKVRSAKLIFERAEPVCESQKTTGGLSRRMPDGSLRYRFIIVVNSDQKRMHTGIDHPIYPEMYRDFKDIFESNGWAVRNEPL